MSEKFKPKYKNFKMERAYECLKSVYSKDELIELYYINGLLIDHETACKYLDISEEQLELEIKRAEHNPIIEDIFQDWIFKPFLVDLKEEMDGRG